LPGKPTVPIATGLLVSRKGAVL